MYVFDFPYHQFETDYPQSGTTVQLGGGYTFTAPPSGPDLRKFTLRFETMVYYLREALYKERALSDGTYVRGTNPTTIPSSDFIYDSTLGQVVWKAPTIQTYFMNNAVIPFNIAKSYEWEVEYEVVAVGTSAAPQVQLTAAYYNATTGSHSNLQTIGSVVNITTPGVFTLKGTVAPTAGTNQGAWSTTPYTYFRPTFRVYGTLTPTTDIRVRRFTVNETTYSAGRANPHIDRTHNRQYNMQVLNDFYDDHKLYRAFVYPHPVYGNVTVKFASPLRIPKGRKGGTGAMEDFTIELMEVLN